MMIGVFDVLGPIMIGPSSSHTAGAARLGKVALSIADGDIEEVDFILHGSFAKTYRGHGTDRALVAGILGMEPCDIRLRNSLEIAKEKNIKVNFKEEDLGDVHPNTVKFVMKKRDGSEAEVIGSSIGGGSIVISSVNGEAVEFTGTYPTLIISHIDMPGAVSKVSNVLYRNYINIAFMKVIRKQKGKGAVMVFEVDHSLNERIISEIKGLESITKVISINPARNGDESDC